MPIRKHAIIPVICAGAVLAMHETGQADSLWEKRSRNRAFLFYDQPLLNVGDHVTVLVNQSTIVANTENKRLSKKTKTSESLDLAGASSGGFAEQGADLTFDLDNESERTFQGDAQARIDNRFTDKVTATIREVQPNGNLVITGSRDVEIDGNKRTLMVAGVIRRQDVSTDNTIGFERLAESRIAFLGEGEKQSFLKQGWLGRGMNKLWPF